MSSEQEENYFRAFAVVEAVWTCLKLFQFESSDFWIFEKKKKTFSVDFHEVIFVHHCIPTYPRFLYIQRDSRDNSSVNCVWHVIENAYL